MAVKMGMILLCCTLVVMLGVHRASCTWTRVMGIRCPAVQCTANSLRCSVGGGRYGVCPTCIDPSKKCLCPDYWTHPDCRWFKAYMAKPKL